MSQPPYKLSSFYELVLFKLLHLKTLKLKVFFNICRMRNEYENFKKHIHVDSGINHLSFFC